VNALAKATPIAAPARFPLAPLIGREAEQAIVRSALGRKNVRFLTLTGPGGIGKTRLALELTAKLASDYDDGAHVVYLGEVADPELVLPTIARTIGLRGDGPRPILEHLHATLASTKMLLTLDYLEQISVVRPELEQLLEACPEIKILATSRAPLQITDEQILQVPPLQTPDLSRPPPLAELRENESVRLLVQRAHVADPSFAVTQANASDIATICAWLEGLPMAIELAALRLGVFSPAVLRKRLATSMAMRAQDEPGQSRHQLTLRASLAWSNELLSPSSRTIFHRLSVFADGFDAAAAEVVCSGLADGGMLSAKVLDGLVELIDHGLLNQEIVADEPRFTMPETICEYALERLEASCEAETTRRRHATYFLTLAEDAAPALIGPDQEAWLARLETDHHNLRAALRWSLVHDPALSLRLAAALWRFWYARGHIQEGRRWLERTLATGAGEYTVARVRALNGLGVLIWTAGDHERARELQNSSLTLARELGDSWGAAAAQGDLAVIEFEQLGDAARAREATEDVLRQFRALGDRDSEGIALTTLGNIACRQGDLAEATSRFQEALTIARESGDNHAVELSLCNLALSSRLKGDVEEAATYYREALKLAHRLSHSEDLLYCLAGIGGVEVARGRFEPAARLLGAAAAMADVVGTPMQSLEQEQFDRDIAAVRAALPHASFSKAWDTGRSLSLDAAVAEASKAPAPMSRSSLKYGLSDREIEVLRWLVMGMSDREIAAALFISPGTATTHVRNIRGKLGVRSRGAAAAYAVRHGIAGDRRRPRHRTED
jgi:predicted ATPase/DNA-binding CsgD family transcriptional regulator/Tfp pilus assembly protein PilF